MELSYKDSFYYLDFTNDLPEKIFFVNLVNLGFSTLKESEKVCSQVNTNFQLILKKMINYYDKNKFLLSCGENVIKVKKEYLDILFLNLETVLLVKTTKEKAEIEHSLFIQFEQLLVVLKEFSKICKQITENQNNSL